MLDNQERVYPCPRRGNTEYGEDDSHCRICGLFLYNNCTNKHCKTYSVADGSTRYCPQCGSQTTFLASGLLHDWSPSKEALLSIRQLEEELCASSETIISLDDDWISGLQQLKNAGHQYLHDVLEGSTAKICGKCLLVITRDIQTKNLVNSEKYHDQLISLVSEYLGLPVVEEVKIIAYQEYVPVPETIPEEEIPF